MSQDLHPRRSAFPLRWLVVFVALVAFGFGVREYFILRNRTAAIAYLNKTGGEIRYRTPPPTWYPEWLPYREALGWVETIHIRP